MGIQMLTGNTLDKYIKCWEETLLLARRPLLWVPFVLLAVVVSIPLISSRYFTETPFSYFMVPALSFLFGDEALHYPAHLRLLPLMYKAFCLPLVWLIGFALFAWAVYMMIDVLEGRRTETGKYARPLFYALPSLLVLGFVFAIIDGLSLIVDLATTDAAAHVIALFLAAGVALWFKVHLVYSIFFVVVYGDKAMAAMRRSIGFGRRNLALTTLIVATAAVIRLATELSVTSSITNHTQPESVFAWLLLATGLEILTAFFVLAATTFVALKSGIEE